MSVFRYHWVRLAADVLIGEWKECLSMFESEGVHMKTYELGACEVKLSINMVKYIPILDTGKRTNDNIHSDDDDNTDTTLLTQRSPML